VAASLTGAAIAIGFWKWVAPMREGEVLSWSWEEGVGRGVVGEGEAFGVGGGGVNTGGWGGLGVIGLVAGVVAGVAEALGEFFSKVLGFGLAR
jgi:diacylglycerol kinase (CTP)